MLVGHTETHSESCWSVNYQSSVVWCVSVSLVVPTSDVTVMYVCKAILLHNVYFCSQAQHCHVSDMFNKGNVM